jgi:hypothetical protein
LFVEHIAVVPYVGQVSEHNALCAALSFSFNGLLTMLKMGSSNTVFTFLALWTSTVTTMMTANRFAL